MVVERVEQAARPCSTSGSECIHPSVKEHPPRRNVPAPLCTLEQICHVCVLNRRSHLSGGLSHFRNRPSVLTISTSPTSARATSVT